MKFNAYFSKHLAVLAAPICASSVLITTPSLAATFSTSDTSVNIFNFNQSASSSSVVIDANVLLVTPDSSLFDSDNGESTNVFVGNNTGIVTSEFDALFLTGFPSFANNSIVNQAFGEGSDYSGSAETESTVIGNFFLDGSSNSPTTFAFDFLVSSNLGTSIDNPDGESATSASDVSFSLVNTDTQEVIDFFSISSSLTTTGADLLPSVDSSDNFGIDLFSLNDADVGLSLTDESISFELFGLYEREFAGPINLTLIETKHNTAIVKTKSAKVPEASSIVSLLLFASIASSGLYKKNNRLLSEVREQVTGKNNNN